MAEGSGMSGKIRRCTDSEDFDLGGYSREKCMDLCKAAFVEPLPLKAMIRFTFVCGGGKQVRQKYGEGLVRDMMAALTAVGYVDDNTASLELASAGSFKYQHDTGKDLKYVHVFPRVAPPVDDAGEEGEDEDGAAGAATPADILATAEMAEFKRLFTAYVVGYAPKRRVLEELKKRLTGLEAAEKKLIAREQLAPDEQRLYDTLTIDGLKEKAQVASAEMQAMASSGELTAEEKTQVVDQLAVKEEALEAEIKRVTAEGKEKAQAKLEEQRDKLKVTLAAVRAAAPAPSPPLKHGPEIRKLRTRLGTLMKMEKEAHGHYTLDQLKLLGEKPDLEEAIAELEARSRTWFESDEEFNRRLVKCLKEGGGAKKPAAAAPKVESDGWGSVGRGGKKR